MGHQAKVRILKVRTMAKKKSFASSPDIEVYRTLESNLHELALFLGTTETWYEKQVRVLGNQLRKAREDLDQVETELDKLGEKSRLAPADKGRLGQLMDRAYDLTDIHIVVSQERKLFREAVRKHLF
jgi:hypothetical protein